MKRNIEKINQLADRIEKCEEVEINDAQRETWGHRSRWEIRRLPLRIAPACLDGHQQAHVQVGLQAQLGGG